MPKPTTLKKNWKLQCLICSRSRKPTNEAYVLCPEKYGDAKIYYGSDMFTGFISCELLDIMQDPFKKNR